VIRPSREWRRAWLALAFAASFVPVGAWVARNAATFGHASFSQASTVGWQSYQGLCFTNFDWWDRDDVAFYVNHPVLSRMLQSSCMKDDELGALDAQVKKEMLDRCLLGAPAQAAVNVAAKGTMLFINWGQFLPYTEIPAELRWAVNACLALYWWCVAWALGRRFRSLAAESAPARYAVLGLGYVVLVTLPFAVDARYLLGPFTITWCVAVALAGSPWALLREGWPTWRR
jgi:hypothetical protein